MKRLLLCSMLVALAACQRETPEPQAPVIPDAATTQAPAATPPVAGPLQDVVERDPRYMIGISFPPGIDKYPGLAAELQGYADGARNDLKQAVDALGADKPSAPYELSLAFETRLDTPQMVAVSADGSSYTGGAHGNPLLARFVWLPQQNQLLKASALIPDAKDWRGISDAVREQLHAALSQRIDADDTAPADRAGILQSGLKMIDEGTGPDVANFEQFEPVLDADGKLTALRFVFPPYQVGPYSDGVQSVEVPANVLLPHVAPAYRALFAGG
jgi:hypothetical protein